MTGFAIAQDAAMAAGTIEHPLCTCWNGAPENTCGALATARRGMRCASGCWGEGTFDYACDEHRPILALDDEAWHCHQCNRSTLTLFPLQELAS